MIWQSLVHNFVRSGTLEPSTLCIASCDGIVGGTRGQRYGVGRGGQGAPASSEAYAHGQVAKGRCGRGAALKVDRPPSSRLVLRATCSA